jgi:hypothetical protein
MGDAVNDDPEPVWEPCVCGGVIVARDRADIEAAILRHHSEVRHLMWRLDNLAREREFLKPDRKGRLYE